MRTIHPGRVKQRPGSLCGENGPAVKGDHGEEIKVKVMDQIIPILQCISISFVALLIIKGQGLFLRKYTQRESANLPVIAIGVGGVYGLGFFITIVIIIGVGQPVSNLTFLFLVSVLLGLVFGILYVFFLTPVALYLNKMRKEIKENKKDE